MWHHGPAVWFLTEVFECFNVIFWMCSLLSNHQALSCDIAVKFTDLECVKQMLSGGYWHQAEGWVQAGRDVRTLLYQTPSILVGLLHPHDILELSSCLQKQSMLLFLWAIANLQKQATSLGLGLIPQWSGWQVHMLQHHLGIVDTECLGLSFGFRQVKTDIVLSKTKANIILEYLRILHLWLDGLSKLCYHIMHLA